MSKCDCGGELNISLSVTQAPGCCCGECYLEYSSEVCVYLSCNKCKKPKLNGRKQENISCSDIEDLLNVK